MSFFKRTGFALFWLLALADIILIMVQQEELRFFTKPLLMPVLLITILSKTGFNSHRTSKILIILALLFATAGDVLLLFEKDTFFFSGLAAFLIMQLLYSIYFLRVKAFRSSHTVSIIASFLLISVMISALAYLFWDRLGELKTPLVIYGFSLAVMFTTAVNVYHYRLTKSLALEAFIPGAALFVLSDLILAGNMFYLKESFVGVAVMATYCGAQYYIARGFIRHLK